MIPDAKIDRLAVNRIDEAAIEFEILRRDLNLERNLSSGLAGFEPLKLCELICMHTNLASDLEQHRPR